MLEGRVQRNYEALNQRDVPTIMSWFADDAVLEIPGNSPMSGRFEGKANIEAWWRRFAEHYEYVHFTVRQAALANPLKLNVSNTLFVAWDLEVRTTDGISASASAVTESKIRRGKIVLGRDYFFDHTVLDELWGRRKAPAASRQTRARRTAVGASV